ncbi:hypothetical protein KCU91_g12459, partial [Aureobasidium melanogenum]
MNNSTDAESSSEPPSKRKRVVTACLECYRSCDRRKPCQNCVNRNVAAKCIYEQPLPQSTVLQFKSHSPVSAEDNSLPLESTPDGTALSSFYDVHAFTDLKKLLKTDEVFQVSEFVQETFNQIKPSSKFWVLAAQLPDSHVITKAFNYYFDEVHWRYNVGQRYYMNKQLDDWKAVVQSPASQQIGIDKNLPYFVAFSFQLLAVILQYMRPDREISRLLGATNSKSAAHMSRRYNDAASELMLMLGRHNGTITVVDYDLLRACWLKNNGRGIESWYAISDGVRQAQQLNLHREPRFAPSNSDSSKNLKQFWFQEYGRRVWVNLFCWDSGTALNLGRPRMINAKDCDIILPVDQSFPDDLSHTVPIPQNQHTPSPLSLLLFRYKIAGKIHEIREYGLDKQDADYISVWTFHDELNNLLNDLPSYLNPNNPATHVDSEFSYLPLHREEASSQLNLVIMELHRPFIAKHPQSRSAAMKAAIGSIDNQKMLMELSGRHHYSYFGFGFYTTNAAMVLAAIARIYPDKNQVKLIESKVQQALSILVNIQNVNIVARASLPVIQRLYDKIQGSLHTNFSSPTDLSSHDSATSQYSGNLSAAAPSMDILPITPFTAEFMPENAEDSALQNFTDLPAWTEIPQVNDFDAAFWLDQLSKLPDNMPQDGTLGQNTMW